MATNGTAVTVSRIPDCDLGTQCPSRFGPRHPARYDAATTMGPWAYLCEEGFRAFGIGLGTGRGQRLVLRRGDTLADLRDSDPAPGAP